MRYMIWVRPWRPPLIYRERSSTDGGVAAYANGYSMSFPDYFHDTSFKGTDPDKDRRIVVEKAAEIAALIAQ